MPMNRTSIQNDANSQEDEPLFESGQTPDNDRPLASTDMKSGPNVEKRQKQLAPFEGIAGAVFHDIERISKKGDGTPIKGGPYIKIYSKLTEEGAQDLIASQMMSLTTEDPFLKKHGLVLLRTYLAAAWSGNYSSQADLLAAVNAVNLLEKSTGWLREQLSANPYSVYVAARREGKEVKYQRWVSCTNRGVDRFEIEATLKDGKPLRRELSAELQGYRNGLLGANLGKTATQTGGERRFGNSSSSGNGSDGTVDTVKPADAKTINGIFGRR